jgi:chromosome segregation ATPase
MSSTKNDLKTSLKDAKDKCEKLSEANRELKDRLVKVKEDCTKIKIDYDNLLIASELLSCNTHEAINPVVKIDVATVTPQVFISRATTSMDLSMGCR